MEICEEILVFFGHRLEVRLLTGIPGLPFLGVLDEMLGDLPEIVACNLETANIPPNFRVKFNFFWLRNRLLFRESDSFYEHVELLELNFA